MKFVDDDDDDDDDIPIRISISNPKTTPIPMGIL